VGTGLRPSSHQERMASGRGSADSGSHAISAAPSSGVVEAERRYAFDAEDLTVIR
jgi:hypothetical protein